MKTPSSRPRRPAFLSLLLLLGLVACAPGTAGDERAAADDRVRERAAALFTEDRFAEAAAALAPLLEREGAPVEDLLAGAIVQMALGDGESAMRIVERARVLAPGNAAVAFLRGNLLLAGGEAPEQAAEALRQVVAAHPDDPAARLQLARALNDLGDLEGAEQEYEAVRALGIEFTGSFHVTATYQLAQLLVRSGRKDAGMALLEEKQELEDAGFKAATYSEVERGRLGRLVAPAVQPLASGPPSTLGFPAFDPVAEVPLAHAGASGLRAADLDGDGRIDLFGHDGGGLSFGWQQPSGTFSASNRPDLGGAAFAVVGDLDNDGPQELVLVRFDGGPDASAVVVYTLGTPGSGEGGTGTGTAAGDPAAPRPWKPWIQQVPTRAVTRSVALTDFDHDGDLDLVLATAEGAQLLRNDGPGLLVDATPPAAAALGSCRGVIPEDIDGDNDVDLLVVTDRGLAALTNMRSGRFDDATANWTLPAGGPGDATLADLDADGRPDLVLQQQGSLAWQRFDGEHFTDAQPLGVDGVERGGWLLADLNLDGHPDVIALGASEGDLPGGRAWAAWAVAGPLADRDPAPARHDLAGVDSGWLLMTDVIGREPGQRPPGDPDGDDRGAQEDDRPSGDGALELVLLTDTGARVLRAADAANAISLQLVGGKDNLSGTGAVVEVRAGPLYQRRYWRGERAVIGLGSQASADIVRVTWPNGVVQHLFDVPAGQGLRLVQVDRLVGSCPFLYTWNGRTFEFVTDVLGATPLGLPLGPDRMVPFDHEEYVKIRGDQLLPRDGHLDLALTEELREVTYLDRVRLHAIDHPATVEIQPNEGFVFPPFPEHHVHTFRDVLAPAAARAWSGPGASGSRGGVGKGVEGGVGNGAVEDLTELLSAVDGHCARPFQPLPPQYLGLCEPWVLELAFGASEQERAALAAAPRLRLALTGWLQWGDASVNMSAARHPEIEFSPPVLWVPDGEDWRAVGAPIGFPAGKTKTLVVDLTDVLDRDDPRLRLTTTLELSWDAIRLVLDDDDAPWSESVLEAASADLAFRGFSRPIPTDRRDGPERFEWDALLESAPWNQHPGDYTRYGDVLPLLDAVDDRYVIFGAGDALQLRFDASGLPALPAGWTRDYLLYVDGWAKDGDPNTLGGQSVEPLPFHGMSRYPPLPGEIFPSTSEHRDWRDSWNTRPGRVLLPVLHDG